MYSQHGCRYHRHLYYINMWRHMKTENNAKKTKMLKHNVQAYIIG